MPNWRKLVVSGSDANLSNLNVDNAVTASFFVGDGSALTNITSTVVETATVTDTFTSQSSIAVSHNFDTRNILVSVYDNSYNQVIPASVVLTDLDTVTVGFDSTTSGTVVVAKGGHVVSGSIAADITTQDITDLGELTFSGSLLPHTTEVFDLGSTSKRWRDLYLSGSTIDLGGTKITRDSATGDIEFKDAGGTRKSLKVDELILGTGATQKKLKVNNGKISFTDTLDSKIGDTATEIIASDLMAWGELRGLTTASGHIVPGYINQLDLGTASKPWRNIHIGGTINGINLNTFSSSVATSLNNTASDWDSVTNKPSNLVSSSAQITSLIDGQNVTLGAVTASSLTETSALRFKESIQEDINSSLINELRPVSYKWKDSKEKDYGFIAEEVDKLDHILTTRNSEGEMLGIKYTKLIPFLVKKVQEQEERIKQLENGNS